MADYVTWLMDQEPGRRRSIVAKMSDAERATLKSELEFREKNPWLKYRGDPVGFVTEGLGETIWGKQREILRSLMENQRTAVPACHAPGKAMANGTPVLTTEGWKAIEAVRVGDLVYGEDGNPHPVTGVYPQGQRDLYRVSFNDGSEVTCDGEHLWATTVRRGAGKDARRVLTVNQILAKVGQRPTGWDRPRIPLTAPVNLPAGPVPIEPYLYGLLLGDASTVTVTPRFTTADPELLDHIHALGYRTSQSKHRPYDHNILGLHEECRDAGLVGKKADAKTVDRRYLNNSAETRLALLQGLMDTDGWVDTGNGDVAFCSTSPSLAWAVVELVRSLGGVTRPIRVKDTTHLRAYVVHLVTRQNPFRLARKAKGWEQLRAARQTTLDRLMVAIEPVGRGEATCISVASPGNTYLTKSYIVTHNTHIAARAVGYFAACYPPGTTKVLTTATTFRQVERVLWPHIRRLHHNHMPELGYTNTVQWMIGTPPEAVVEGFKPSDDDEAATQGTHAPNLLIVVDEAGGIKNQFGMNLESLMTGGNTRMLLLGNPPVSAEQSWFERQCNNPRFNVIRIGAFDTPFFTGEETDWCRACPQGMEPHKVVTHLVDDVWVDGIRDQFGEDSAYYIARVLAQFPRDNTSKTLPMSWLEIARDNVLEGTEKQRIKLGVDIASDGGDEFVIARLDGWRATIRYAKAGADNEDPVQVAGKILEEIRIAEADHLRRGISEPVRVKIDCIGVGWGVTGLLETWRRERRFNAEIVGVNVSKSPRSGAEYASTRSEMWWNTRRLIQPDEDGENTLWLDIGVKELSQLNGPTYGTDSSGRITIEKKADMKKRGVASPDRAEAILLAAYEPPGAPDIALPMGMGQTNAWAALGR